MAYVYAGSLGVTTRFFVGNEGQVDVFQGGTRAGRNYNPGNLRAGSFTRANGAIGVDSNGFAIFPTYEAGRAAQSALLQTSRYQELTLDGLIKKYAPPSENDTELYQRIVSQSVGVDGTTLLSDFSSDQFKRLLDAIQGHEGYKTAPIVNSYTADSIPTNISALIKSPGLYTPSSSTGSGPQSAPAATPTLPTSPAQTGAKGPGSHYNGRIPGSGQTLPQNLIPYINGGTPILDQNPAQQPSFDLRGTEGVSIGGGQTGVPDIFSTDGDALGLRPALQYAEDPFEQADSVISQVAGPAGGLSSQGNIASVSLGDPIQNVLSAASGALDSLSNTIASFVPSAGDANSASGGNVAVPLVTDSGSGSNNIIQATIPQVKNLFAEIVGDVVNAAVNFFFSLFPVVLDLSGKGINITQESSSNTFFDGVGDGEQHQTAWAGAGNAVLFYDSTATGSLTRADQVVFTDLDPSAANDMQALEDVFDTNHNGSLDSGDASYADFYLDVTNANGTQTIETLAQAGITSINLTPNAVNQSLPDGSAIQGETTYTTSSGSTGAAATVSFAADSNGYAVAATTTTNADGSTTIDNVASYYQGGVASEHILNTSANGLTKVLTVLNGGGNVETIQTDVTVPNASGSVETLTNYAYGTISTSNHSGELGSSVSTTGAEKLNSTQTTISTSGGTTATTILRDQLGGGPGALAPANRPKHPAGRMCPVPASVPLWPQDATGKFNYAAILSTELTQVSGRVKNASRQHGIDV